MCNGNPLHTQCCRALILNKQKVLLSVASSAYKHSLKEVMASPGIASQIKVNILICLLLVTDKLANSCFFRPFIWNVIEVPMIPAQADWLSNGKLWLYDSTALFHMQILHKSPWSTPSTCVTCGPHGRLQRSAYCFNSDSPLAGVLQACLARLLRTAVCVSFRKYYFIIFALKGGVCLTAGHEGCKRDASFASIL